MIISQSGIVDIIPEYNRQLRPIFCVSEGDKNTRMINITVQQAGENFSIPSGASVYVTGKKQDNTIFTYQCTKSGYIVSFQIAEQMSAANGIVLCELQIIENGNPLGSANFVYWVEPSPVQNGTASESDLNVFLEAILGAEKLDRFYANVEDMVAQAVENMQIHEGQTVIDASLSVSGAAADAKATGDIVRAFMNALITETTEESTVATCDDAAGGLPLKTLTANIVPAQAGSGDPSPDNVRPITGYTGVTVTRTGKNVADVPTGTTNGITITKNDDGTYTFTGTATRTTTITIFSYNSNLALSPFNGNYKIIVAGLSASNGGFYASDLNGDRIMTSKVDGTYTTSVGVGRVWLYFSSGAVVSGYHVQFMVFPAELSDDYEGYTGATYPVTFPTAAGTVYGGSLVVYADGSGTLTVDRAYYSSTSVATVGTPTASANGNRAGFAIPGVTIAADSADFLCSCGTGDLAVNGASSGWRVGTAALYKGTSQTFFRYIFPTSITTGADALQYLNDHNCEIVLPITNPTTYALSALQVVQMLNGVNNIWTDAAGTLTAEYYASTGLYVEKKVNAQRNMIAGVEEAMTATKNYSVNDLLIVGNTLYKVTAAVSSGAALVVGTNVTETTVAEQLLALA